MTQKPAPIIETHRLNEADAQQLERQMGCLVVLLPVDILCMTVYPCPDDADAHRTAAYLARQSPHLTFGVFKLARAYHAQPGELPGVPEPSVEVRGDT